MGAIEFKHTLVQNGCTADVIIAEAETFLYASRSDGPAQARIFRIKEAVPLAALPANHTRTVLDAIKDVYPQFIDGIDVLHTGLNNMGAIFHPALTILNAGRIESTRGDFQFYIDGVTPSVAGVLEAIDRERVTVAAAIGIRARTSMEWLQIAYNVTGINLYEAIHESNRVFWHQSTGHPEPPLHLRRRPHEPGAHRFHWKAVWSLCPRHGTASSAWHV